MSVSLEKAIRAEQIRIEKAEKFLDVNVNVSPTKGVNSGAHGSAAELLTARFGSLKTNVAKTWQVDLFIRFLFNGKVVSKAVERKTNGGEITQVINKLAKGQNGVIIYSLDICNSNTCGKRRTVSPRIMYYSTFISLLESINAIEYNKPATNGQFVHAIRPTRKGLVELLEQQTEYDDSRIMDINEIF